MTPTRLLGSHIFSISSFALAAMISGGCGARTEAKPVSEAPARPVAAPAPRPADPPHAAEACLGVADKGIFADLDDRVQLTLPAGLAAENVTAIVDTAHGVLVLSIEGHPRKAYPLGGTAALKVGTLTLALRPGDRAELAPLLTQEHVAEGTAAHDRDNDGIPDPLDILIGAKKAALDAAPYTNVGYVALSYPGGDVPRHQGVCTDVIVRAVRNAGLDLQRDLHEDIIKRRKAFPMIKKNADANIDQRRVGTLLPYFKKHWESHAAKLDDPQDPLRPGDIILMDTFPSRSGPDHIGIISDTLGPGGLPLVINAWDTGTVTSEMDLLSFVPVLYRFRLST
jgi:uncharacterized protein YijF (DUF1287 family)